MRLRYFILSVIAILIVSCSTEEPNDFVDSHFIKFRYGIKDKDYYQLEYNFANGADDVTAYELKIPVEYMGRDITQNLYFCMIVDSEKTTLPADYYDLKLEQEFRQGIGSVDSLRVTLFRKPLLKEEAKTLRLQLVANNDFQIYMPDSSYISIDVVDIFSRPIWWDSSVENAYLGKYSKAKYDAFTTLTNCYDFGSLEPSEKRYYALLFKRELEKKPVWDDENNETMSVTIPG